MSIDSLRKRYQQSKRLVMKVGSSLLTRDGQGLAVERIGDWVRQIAALKKQGKEVVLVSSGAVAEGMQRLGWKSRPQTLHELQAAAAVGQMGLIQTYESAFQTHGLHTAQILLTHGDLADRTGYLNARSTLRTLLSLGVVPIVNENDTVATEEIRFGDNDRLAASVCNLVEAGALFLLTDQMGMFDKNPGEPGAVLIQHANSSDSRLAQMAGAGGSGPLGRGGMVTKVRAARRAARSGAATFIADGKEADILLRLSGGESLGTFLQPDKTAVTARKQWMAAQLPVRGRLYLDEGAVRVLAQGGKSLLPVGVIQVEGRFERGELVLCCDSDGREVARGLVNYNSDESEKIAGHGSREIMRLLGYMDEPELIHADNLVIG